MSDMHIFISFKTLKVFFKLCLLFACFIKLNWLTNKKKKKLRKVWSLTLWIDSTSPASKPTLPCPVIFLLSPCPRLVNPSSCHFLTPSLLLYLYIKKEILIRNTYQQLYYYNHHVAPMLCLSTKRTPNEWYDFSSYF